MRLFLAIRPGVTDTLTYHSARFNLKQVWDRIKKQQKHTAPLQREILGGTKIAASDAKVRCAYQPASLPKTSSNPLLCPHGSEHHGVGRRCPGRMILPCPALSQSECFQL